MILDLPTFGLIVRIDDPARREDAVTFHMMGKPRGPFFLIEIGREGGLHQFQIYQMMRDIGQHRWSPFDLLNLPLIERHFPSVQLIKPHRAGPAEIAIREDDLVYATLLADILH